MENKRKILYLDQLKDFLDSGTTKAKITKIVLCTLALASTPVIAGVVAGVGNAVQIFDMFDRKKYKRRQITLTVANLKRRKLIEYVSEKNGIMTVQITRNGHKLLRRFAMDSVKVPKVKKWDNKWRMVMFDLPIRFSKVRNSLRFKLKQLGFVQFQKSVWIYPYPCEEEILFIADYYKIGKYIEFLDVNNLKNELKYKKIFNLL